MHFYDEMGNKYITHIDAIKSGHKCKFFYHDDFFSKADWKTKSMFSLDTLYRMRAEEIRSKYDHVVLCLSGGVDSRNVFETFYHNKIHIDEILCVGAFSQDSERGSFENNNDEIHGNTIPMLNDVSLPHNTKITYFDYSKLFSEYQNFTLIKEFGNQWAYEMPYTKSFHHFFWYDLNKHLGISESKQTCFIMGTGKTCFALDNNKPYINFKECDMMDYGGRYQMGSLTRENFYFAPTFIGVEMMKKQAEIMINVYNLTEDKKSFWVDYLTKLYPKYVYNLEWPLLKPTRKSTRSFFSHRDTFMKKHTNSDFYKIWYDGISKVSAEIGLDYKSHFSKQYFI